MLKISCDTSSADHMVKTCEQCSELLDAFLTENLEAEAGDPISFNEWLGGDLTKKI